MTKKLIAMMLVLVLCLSMFAGCTGNDDGNSDDTGDDTVVSTLDPNKTYAKYDPDTVVMTINGDEITWTEFFYMMYSGVTQLQSYVGDFNWTDLCITGTETNEEYVMTFVMESLMQFHLIHNKAQEMNISLTDDEQSALTDLVQSYKDYYCGEGATEEDFDEFLKTIYLNRDVFDFVNQVSYEYNHVFTEIVGDNGEKLTDEEVAEYVEELPFVTAKHILIKTVDDNGLALSDDEVAAAKTQADALYAELSKITDPVQLDKRFDELVEAHNQDEGMAYFPDGYTFTTGEMVEEFESAAFALEEYGLSEPVESKFGYHIILRMPTTRDSVVEYMTESNGYTTVGYYAAVDVFNTLLYTWMDEADIQWSKEFEDITCEELFA